MRHPTYTDLSACRPCKIERSFLTSSYEIVSRWCPDSICTTETLVGNPSIKACNKLNIFKLIIGDKLVVRFKKLRANYIVMPPCTEQSEAWYSDHPLQGIPNSLTRVTVGYVMSHEQQDIEDVAVTSQTSTQSVAWHFSIPEEADIMSIHDIYTPETQEHLPIP